MGFDQKVRDIKPYLLDKACEFLKEKTKSVTQALTKTHHQTI